MGSRGDATFFEVFDVCDRELGPRMGDEALAPLRGRSRGIVLSSPRTMTVLPLEMGCYDVCKATSETIGIHYRGIQTHTVRDETWRARRETSSEGVLRLRRTHHAAAILRLINSLLGTCRQSMTRSPREGERGTYRT